MFDIKILDKLIELNINTIANIVKEAKNAKGVYLISTLSIGVDMPYFFMTLYDDSQLDELIRGSGVVGYIILNGITTLILYITKPERQNEFLSTLGIKDNSLNYFVNNTLAIQYTDKITIFHKEFKNKERSSLAPKSILDDIAELSQKPNNIFYTDYSKKHPCFYLYKQSLTRKIFNTFKVTGISTSTSQAMAVKRLNNYLDILEKYQVISEQITYIAEDIRKNKLLIVLNFSGKLFHKKFLNLFNISIISLYHTPILYNIHY